MEVKKMEKEVKRESKNMEKCDTTTTIALAGLGISAASLGVGVVQTYIQYRERRDTKERL